MASSKQFYRQRLGLNPYETQENGANTAMRDGHTTGADFKTFGGYEESLSKFKGIVYSLNIYQLIGTPHGVARAFALVFNPYSHSPLISIYSISIPMCFFS